MAAAAQAPFLPAPAPDSPLFSLAEEQVGQQTTAQPRLFKIPERHRGTRVGGFTELELRYSRNVKSLEKVCADWIRGAKEKKYQSERASLDAYQESEDHYKKNSLWERC